MLIRMKWWRRKAEQAIEPKYGDRDTGQVENAFNCLRQAGGPAQGRQRKNTPNVLSRKRKRFSPYCKDNPDSHVHAACPSS